MIAGILLWASPREKVCSEGGGGGERCPEGESLWDVQDGDERARTAALFGTALAVSVLNFILIRVTKENNSRKRMRVSFDKLATGLLFLTGAVLLASALASHKHTHALRVAALTLASVGASVALLYSGTQIRHRFVARKG